MDTLRRAQELFFSGLQHQKEGRFEQAESLYRKALELAPDRPSVINNLAAVLLQLKRYGDARFWCEKLIATDAGNATATLNLGNCHLALGSPQTALAFYDAALAIEPHYVEALASRGKALIELRRPAEALASCDKALAIQPADVELLNSRGSALADLHCYPDALSSFDSAVAIKPDFAEAYYNRGNVLRDLGRYQEALADYSLAVAIKPDFVDAHWNDSLCRLLIGDFAKGWEKYEWRWQNATGLISRRDFPIPPWDGKYLDGVLLVWGEQALGEQILYASMLHDLGKRAKRLVVEVEPRLVQLFARSFPGTEIIPRGGRSAMSVDAHVPMGPPRPIP